MNYTEKAKALAIEYGCGVDYITMGMVNSCLEGGINESILNPQDINNLVKDIFYPVFSETFSINSGFSRLGNDVIFRPDELSIWFGINGHGKSQLLGQIALNIMAQGERVMIVSLEMKPERVCQRMFRQASGLRSPSKGYLDAIALYYTGKLFFANHQGSISGSYLISLLTHAIELYGIKFFIIDSMMKCGMKEDDYNEQKVFMDNLCDFKSQYDCHIHLVAHPRKGSDEYQSPGKMDIKGTGTISDLADNCYSVWRNKRKEDNPDEHKGKADAFIKCTKQRNGEWEGSIPLWFDKDSLQFLDYEGQRPKQYVQYSITED